MHEMALAEGLIDLVEEEGRKAQARRVTVVRLSLGALGHVEPEAIRFCFDAVSRGTLAEGATLAIDIVPGAGWCLDCARTVPLSERFGACPDCGQHHVQMTAGDELRLSELEVE
ncbi:MAG: hydrogenase maturation nickel metallochaperone HypA [Alsobacter sp.]